MTNNYTSREGDGAACPSSQFKRLSRRHVTMIALGGVIGAGLFVGSSAGIAGAGPAVILTYVIAGLMVFLVLRSMGEMAIESPGSGSFVGQIRRGLGDRAAFVVGWTYWVFWSVTIGTEAIAGAAVVTPYIQAFIPISPSVVALSLIVVLAATNLFSVRGYGEFEFWFSFIKVMAIILFIVTCIIFVALGSHAHAGSITNLWAHGGFFPKGVMAALAIVPTTVFSFSGSEVATVAAAESDDPGGNVAQATNSVVLRVVLFYVVSLSLVLCVLPWTNIVSGQSPFVAALGVIGVPGARDIMAAVVFVAVASCLNSCIYITSRMTAELGQHGDAPCWMSKRSSKGTPYASILSGTAVGVAMTLIAILSPHRAFAIFVSASGALLLFTYLMACLAQIKLRQKMVEEGRSPRFAVWLFPYLSWAVCVAIVTVLVAMLFDPTTRSQIVLGTAVVTAITFLQPLVKRGSNL